MSCSKIVGKGQTLIIDYLQRGPEGPAGPVGPVDPLDPLDPLVDHQDYPHIN